MAHDPNLHRTTQPKPPLPPRAPTANDLNRHKAAGSDVSFFSLTPDGLGEQLEVAGQPRYRAAQIMEWVYTHGADSFDQMTNLPLSLRQSLADRFKLYESKTIRRLESGDGTHKLLLQWPDGATTECVMIPDTNRVTACVSTQVGCPVGCVFCASGLAGLQRQLSSGQIVEQAMRVRKAAGRDASDRLSNIVFMGLGEPLHNYDATVAAVRAINADWGMNIAARKITISTIGLPKQIRQLAGEGWQITLAISLHAPDDALRRRIIPWAQSITIDSLVDAANHFFAQTGREVTLEYVLLGGLNDRSEHARALASVAKRMRSRVNLIRYNPVEGLPYQRPTAQDAHAFQQILRNHGVNSHLRKSRGLDIDAACGQLRRRHTATGLAQGNDQA